MKVGYRRKRRYHKKDENEEKYEDIHQKEYNP